MWFASEIGALLSADAVPRELDRSALDELLHLGYVSEPRTPFAHIQKVAAGSVVTIRNGNVETLRYWHPFASVEPSPSPAAVLDRLRAAVARQTRADVPIGIFTSGGLDSALIARLTVDLLGAKRVRTFAVGFPDRSYDERRYAARLSAALGTTHLGVEVSDEEVPEALDTLARRCRPHATVVLTGEGADELFGGYPTYVGHRLVPAWRRLPAVARAAIRRIVTALPASQQRVTIEFLLKRFLTGADLPWRARHLAWFGSGVPAGPGYDANALATVEAGAEEPTDVVAAAMRLDYVSSLRERLLVKIDRATIARRRAS